MVLAGSLWGVVLVYLMTFREVPARTFLSALFFVGFFGLSVLYYVRTAIFIDARGLTYRGIVRTERFSFEDIRKVDVIPGLVTVYSVRAGARFVHFTSFFGHHRRLVDLVVEKAGLRPGQ